MTFQSRIKIFAASAALLAFQAHGALAQDAAKLGEALKAAFDKQGSTVNWSDVSQNGSQFVFEGVTLVAKGGKETLPVGAVTMEDVSEQGGGFLIGRLTLPNYTKTEAGVTFDMKGVEATNMRVPAPTETDPVKNLMLYDSIKVASIAFQNADVPAFTMNEMVVNLTPAEGSNPWAFAGNVKSFTADLSSVPDPKAKQVIDALGYQTLNGFFEMAGSWNPSDGRLELSQYDIAIKDAGTLGITVNLSGYTPQFIKSVQELQQKMAAQPAGTENSQQGLAMLGLMQQLNFEGLSFRFDDASLTGKIVDYVAKQQNVTPADIVNQVKALAPFALAQLNNPDLSQQVSAAINAYMDDPKSIEIAARPPQPLPFAQLAATASANPLELTKQLGLVVSANAGETKTPNAQ